ncbi:MAG: alpha/beta hydrolase [Clostridiales bacterium]|nr:alpha/beta hydrolase [Clostridiales bacterium]
MTEFYDEILEENKEARERWQKELDLFPQHKLWEGRTPDYKPEFKQPEPSFIFLPAPGGKGKGCVIVMAGGGYTFKSTAEGVKIAKALNVAGINAAVLDYRLIPYEKDVIVSDAKRCVRQLYARADEFEIDRDKIGLIGFSAGGNLAAMTAFLGDDGDPQSSDPVDRCPCRPAAVVLAYAAVILVDEYDDDDEFNLFSFFEFKYEEGMTCPPVFMWQSFEDILINYQASFALVDLLRKKRVPVELHMYPYGPHGQSLALDIDYKNPKNSQYDALAKSWGDLCMRWLHFYGF